MSKGGDQLNGTTLDERDRRDLLDLLFNDRGRRDQFEKYGTLPDGTFEEKDRPRAARLRKLLREAERDVRVRVAASVTANGSLGSDDASTTTKLRPHDVGRMAREEPPPVPWLVEPLVVRGALTILVGKPGEGKSLLAMTLAAGVAAGIDQAGLKCQRGPVAIIDAENGEHEIHRRVRALGLPEENVELYEAEGFDLRTDWAELEGVLERKPALLVLDSFRSLWGGDENDTRDGAAVVDRLRNAVRAHGIGAVLVHHTAKNNGVYRGSSAIAASTELGFVLARAEGDPDRTRRFLDCWKSRPAPEPDRHWLRLSTERGLVLVDEAEPYDSPEPASPGRPATASQELGPQLLEHVQAGVSRQADLARAVHRKPSDGSVRRVLQALERDAEIERRDGEWLPVAKIATTPRDPDKFGNASAAEEAEAERLRLKFEDHG